MGFYIQKGVKIMCDICETEPASHSFVQSPNFYFPEMVQVKFCAKCEPAAEKEFELRMDGKEMIDIQ